jgi:gas vesicle protein
VPVEVKCADSLNEVATKLPNTFVFDRHFVDSNVYSGLSHDKDHKEQLFTLLLGEKVLELTQKQNELQDTITQTTNSIKILKSSLDSIVRTIDSNKDHTVLLSTVLEEDFSQDTTSSEISKLDKQLQNSKTILDRPLLSTLELPAVFNLEKIKTELSESIKNVSTAAYEKVQTHLTQFHVTSNWINQGFSKIKDNLCPLCGSSIEDNELIKSFPSFFNQEYDQLAEKIEQSSNQISQEIFKQSHIHTINKNVTLLTEWFEDNKKINTQLQIKQAFDTYFNFANEQYQTKQSKLLEEISSEVLNQPSATVSAEIKSYNEQIETINNSIEKIKTEASDLNKLKDQQINLKLQLVKFQKNDEIESFQTDLTTLQRNKEDLRLIQEQIKTEIDSFLKQYGESINKCLENFRVDFQINLAKKVQSNIKNIQAEITVLKNKAPLIRIG